MFLHQRQEKKERDTRSSPPLSSFCTLFRSFSPSFFYNIFYLFLLLQLLYFTPPSTSATSRAAPAPSPPPPPSPAPRPQASSSRWSTRGASRRSGERRRRRRRRRWPGSAAARRWPLLSSLPLLREGKWEAPRSTLLSLRSMAVSTSWTIEAIVVVVVAFAPAPGALVVLRPAVSRSLLSQQQPSSPRARKRGTTGPSFPFFPFRFVSFFLLNGL